MKTKEAADYSKGMKSAHCGICEHFKPGLLVNRCEIVEGSISPDMWCKYFKDRK